MRSERVLGTLASGVIVYVFMACSSAGNGISPPKGKPGDTPTGSATGTAAPTTSPTNPIPNALADTWWVPGSRLKLQTIKASDGAVQFYGWYDSMLSEQCTFILHGDGKQHCVPASQPMSEGVYFASADCTGTTLVHSGDPPLLNYVTVPASTSPAYNSPGVVPYKLVSKTVFPSASGSFSHYSGAACVAGGSGLFLYQVTELTNTVDATIETSQ